MSILTATMNKKRKGKAESKYSQEGNLTIGISISFSFFLLFFHIKMDGHVTVHV